MKEYGRMTFSRLLTEHASATLAGLKSASLISLKNIDEEISQTISSLEEKGVSFLFLKNKSGMDLLLVYRAKLLFKAINDKEARTSLSSFGYKGSLIDHLNHLRERFLYEDFPHEIGFFLNYPTSDVKGFIKHKGKNYKKSLMWKVYGNEEEALSLFNRFEKCRKVYISCYEKGFDIQKLCVRA